MPAALFAQEGTVVSALTAQQLPNGSTEPTSAIQTVSATEPSAALQPVSFARLAELEARLAELEAKDAARTAADAAAADVVTKSVVGDDLLMIPKWNYGFEAQTKDKVFRTKFGGQLQFDYTDYNQAHQLNAVPSATSGGIGRQNESVNFRRLRLRSEGTMYENIGWVVQPDFANAVNVSNVPGNPPGFPNSLGTGFATGQTLALAPTLTDCYITIMKLPVVGNFRVGNFKEPIGLEHLTSSRFLDFMERSYNQDLFYGPFNNGFMPGAMFFNWTENQRATWALWGGPNQSNLFGYHVGGQWAGTARGTYLAWYDEPSNGRYLSHFGGSLSARKPDQGQDRFRARGDLRDGPPSILNTNYLDTGSFNSSFQYEINAEHVTIWGPWTFQAEYLVTWLQGCSYNPLNTSVPASQAAFFAAGPGFSQNTFFQGGYCELLYFLTGESRGYDRRMGIVDRVIPFDNFFLTRRKDGSGCGWGAWQVGLRYSYTDLNSGLINGGMLNAMTFGLNWFLNPNLKLQFNYDIDYRSQVLNTAPGWINAAGARVAFDF
jgi:phosphate-selective porin OprO/OprP